MRDALAERIAERERALQGFLEAERGSIARACHAIARSFAHGGVLIPFGSGAAATDAAHVAVEFMHPVIVGKRALPAVAPTNDPTGASTLARLGRSGDIALSVAHGREDHAVRTFREEARGRGLLTVALTGEGEEVAADFCFAVASDDPQLVQEVQETAYHVLWELVHVFFEHPGLLEATEAAQRPREVDPSPSNSLSLARATEASAALTRDRCITCGDVAVEGHVVALRNGTATVEVDGLREDVAVDLVDEVDVGDRVLCHAGIVLEKLP
jgi:D-sedoheptulose 7-phosphate isomerase